MCTTKVTTLYVDRLNRRVLYIEVLRVTVIPEGTTVVTFIPEGILAKYLPNQSATARCI